MDSYVDSVVQNLNDSFKDGDVSIGQVSTMVKYAMEKVERFDKLHASDRKKVVLSAVHKYIDNNTKIEISLDQLEFMTSTLLPSIIDLIIDATKGRLSVNKVGKMAKLCCRQM